MSRQRRWTFEELTLAFEDATRDEESLQLRWIRGKAQCFAVLLACGPAPVNGLVLGVPEAVLSEGLVDGAYACGVRSHVFADARCVLNGELPDEDIAVGVALCHCDPLVAGMLVSHTKAVPRLLVASSVKSPAAWP